MGRESILSAIKANQPEFMELPSLAAFTVAAMPDVDLYIKTLQGIGGSAYLVKDEAAVAAILRSSFADAKRIISTIPAVAIGTEEKWPEADPHELETVDLAVIKARFAVAENGAVWVTENEAVVRVLPFICEHLAVVLSRKDMVSTMHLAYERIGDVAYGYGVFIAGPSKTADIEQSLVLGAHGPKTMHVFLWIRLKTIFGYSELLTCSQTKFTVF